MIGLPVVLITRHHSTAQLGLTPGTPVNLSIQTGSSIGQQSETAISVDPTDPNNQVVVAIHHLPGFSEIYAFYTIDGGVTWAKVNLPRFTHPLGIEFNYVSDPSVAHDHEGNVYAAFNQRNNVADMHFIACVKSVDGGATWTLYAATDVTSTYVDKPFIAADHHPGSPRLGNLHVVWSDREAAPRATYLSTSTDGGNTWTTRLVVQNNDNVPELGIGPGGDVYVAIAYRDDNEIRLENCGIGGEFCTPANGADVLVAEVAPDNQNITPQPDRNIPMHPVVDVDRSGGPFHNRVYVAYSDYTDGDPDHMDIFIAWADPDPEFAEVTEFFPENKRQVNLDGTATAQFLPWLDVDDADGSIGVLYYSAQDDATNQSVHVYYAESKDGGDTWTNTRVSDVSSNQSICGGNLDYQEYIGLHNQDDCAYAVWTSFTDNVTCADILYNRICDVTIRAESGWFRGAIGSDSLAVRVKSNAPAPALIDSIEYAVDLFADNPPVCEPYRWRGTSVYTQGAELRIGQFTNCFAESSMCGSPRVEGCLVNSSQIEAKVRFYSCISPACGQETPLILLTADAVIGVNEVPAPPSLTLDQNYPNPFNPTTVITFTLPERLFVNLSIFDLKGRLVKTLVDEPLAAGFKDVTWDGRDRRGNAVSSGVYFCRLRAGKEWLTRKLVLLK
jgi:hypothetical protein